MMPADLPDGLNVRHRDRLPTAGVVGDGQHDQRNLRPPFRGNQPVQRVNIHVALEGETGLRVSRLGEG